MATHHHRSGWKRLELTYKSHEVRQDFLRHVERAEEGLKWELAIFMVLMVCGYWYTSRDLSTRFKIKRSFGWDVYFLVALYGCILFFRGVIATGLLWLLLLALSAADNTFHFTSAKYADWQIDFMNWSFLGIQAPVVVMPTFAILFCLYRSNWAGSARLTAKGRKKIVQAAGAIERD